MTRTLTALLVILVLLVGLPGVAVAETRSGGTIVVGPDETIDDDLEVFGGSIVVHGTVTGDLQAFGGDVRISESGTVDGDVEASSGSVSIAGTVGGDVEAAGGSVTVAESAQIDGELQAGAGSVTIDGTVGGDAAIGADTIRLGPTAVIGGDLTYDGELQRADGATVEGSVTQESGVGSDGSDRFAPVLGPLLSVYGIAVTLLVGAILLVAFPRFSRDIADQVADEPVRTGGIGVLAGTGVPVVLVILLITIVGIPLSLAGMLVFGLLLWAGSIYGRYAVGEWLLSYADVGNRWAALVVGTLAVAAVALVPLLGQLAKTVVLVLGFGALILSLGQRYRARDATGPSPTADAEPA